jgi:hypothetical protein
MQRIMLRQAIGTAVIAALAASLAACGGGGSSSASSTSGTSGTSGGTPPTSMATMPLMVSDAPSDDWACIGVKLLSVALIPQGGGSAVTVWTAPTTVPTVNLVQLDSLADVIGNVSVPAGTYSGAILTLSANPGDVLLTANNNPENGFPLAAGVSVPSSAIQIQGTTGSTGSLSVPVTVSFANALTVAANSTDVALNLEFDLTHPTFIVDHTPPAADGAAVWVVNFNGPIRHHPVRDIAALVLRHTYGTVMQVSSASITIDKDYPVYPASNPETEISSATALTIDADSVNGTIVYDLDAGTRTVVDNFGSNSNLTGRFVRVASRYQQNGTLIGVRVWVSSSFEKVWVSPEGHVLNVNAQGTIMTVTNEEGIAVPVTISPSTEFYFRTPADGQTDATAIGEGNVFLTSQQLVRGFKVHVGSLDPLAVPMTASSVDIETAAFGGHISNASASSFTYTSNYRAVGDNYALTLPYIAAATDNGFDNQGNQIQGFDWWYFTFPTDANTSIPEFVAATNGALIPGGSLGTLQAWGESDARWGDGSGNSATASGWYLRHAVIVPTPTPLGTVSTGLSGTAFSVNLLGGATAIPVTLSTTPGQATLVYQINRSGGTVTITPVDISGGGSGLTTLTAALQTGAVVKVWGVPLAGAGAGGGTLAAYVLAYYTGTLPGM